MEVLIIKLEVKEYASEWEKYANIKFKWVSSNSSADIRIKFDARGGHWSMLGTHSKGSRGNL